MFKSCRQGYTNSDYKNVRIIPNKWHYDGNKLEKLKGKIGLTIKEPWSVMEVKQRGSLYRIAHFSISVAVNSKFSFCRLPQRKKQGKNWNEIWKTRDCIRIENSASNDLLSIHPHIVVLSNCNWIHSGSNKWRVPLWKQKYFNFPSGIINLSYAYVVHFLHKLKRSFA